jgi:ribosomal protein S18 acetylase RimI-like enzyme
MDFVFTNEYAPTRIDEIVAFMMGPRLWIPKTDYPDFLDWAQRMHRELKRESKHAIVALAQGNVVGSVIYQRHKQYTDTLEIKNLTVRPDARGRYIASFLMRNAELEGARELGVQTVVCDAKADNLSVRYFLLKHHYRIAGRHDLYRLNSGQDCVYRKRLISV